MAGRGARAGSRGTGRGRRVSNRLACNEFLKNNDLRGICFDTPHADHYHTAPMPTARVPLLDAVVVAAQGALVEREFPLAGFARLHDRLADTAGTARMRLALHRIDDVPTGQLEVTAAVRLVCQ